MHKAKHIERSISDTVWLKSFLPKCPSSINNSLGWIAHVWHILPSNTVSWLEKLRVLQSWSSRREGWNLRGQLLPDELWEWTHIFSSVTLLIILPFNLWRKYFSSSKLYTLYEPNLEYCFHVWGEASLTTFIKTKQFFISVTILITILALFDHRRTICNLYLFYRYFHGFFSVEPL